MTKIITRANLTRRQNLVRDTERNIQRIYALHDILTLRQRSSCVREQLDRIIAAVESNPVDYHDAPTS